MIESAIQATLIGMVATIGMDLWAVITKHVLCLPTTDWAMIGRWFGHMPRGVFGHQPISASPAIRRELGVGWIAHYFTGIVYGLLYLYIVQVLLGSTPSLLSAVIFGPVTLAAPWFAMQPGLGLGTFAKRAPRPWLVRMSNVSMHFVFGVSLYVGWLLLGIGSGK